MYHVICPDGKDRLKACWKTLGEAEFDAKYFTNRQSCRTWTADPEDWSCPGGIHWIEPIEVEPEELAWVVDLAV